MSVAQLKFILKAPSTPHGEIIYLATNLNDWRSGDPNYIFTAHKDEYHLTIPVSKGTKVEYKLTRGSWATVEVGLNGIEQENRHIVVVSDMTLNLAVPQWKDQGTADDKKKNRESEADLRVLGPFKISSLKRERNITVYLPPGYSQHLSQRYPVIYLHDGQNLFDPKTAFNEEWAVDETCDRLIKAGQIPPVIVVGINNGEAHRLSELSPWKDVRYDAAGDGVGFLRWVIDDLKTYIDTSFRTLSEAEHTYIGGSSMGGLSAIYAAYRFPLVFGGAICMSPALWFARSQIFRYIANKQKPESLRVYLDCGELESARVHPKRNFYNMSVALKELLEAQGFVLQQDLFWVSDPQGRHAERDWGRRMENALKLLLT
jgi:predicted alpha/beta superfamily hydrolase